MSLVNVGKETSGQRLTHLLRPNVIRPDSTVTQALNTPPITDDSELSTFEYASESDFLSDRSDVEPDSDAESHDGVSGGKRGAGALSDIAESATSSPLVVPVSAVAEEEWSVVGDSDGDAGDELASSIDSLRIEERRIPLVENHGIRHVPLRASLWERQSLQMRRNASSPSRSPARRSPARGLAKMELSTEVVGKCSFYDYLFS